MTFRLFRSLRLVLLPLCALVTVACGRHPLIDRRLAEELRARVAQNGSPGTVLAVFDKDRVDYLCLGRMGLQDGRKPDEHSLFEVASITKTFTSLLLADMVTRGEVALDDPAEKWIKPPMRTPRFQGRTFSLLDLSTHRSGLERDLPHELDPAGLVKLLGQLSLLSAPGARFNYSNFGVAVLARALADRAGKDYIPLVTERVLQPLGLRDSTFDLLDSDRARLVCGAVPPLGPNMLSPAGGLKASASDLVRYLREQMGEIENPLAQAIALSHVVQAGREPIALGWFVGGSGPGRPVYWHAGRSGGSSAIVFFRPSDGRGVVLLYALASAGGNGMDDLGYAFLDPAAVLQGDWKSSIPLTEAQLERVAGRYATEDGGSVIISTRPGGLSSQVLGSFDLLEYVPQSASDFINAEQHLRLHFNFGRDGKAVSMDVHVNGFDHPNLPRIEN